MAPKVTSSSNRNKRGSAKPVTRGQNPQRANRQAASKATVSQSGGGRGGARVTNASQRTTSGSARVTGGGRPALPPGRRGGAIVRQETKPENPRRTSARSRQATASRGTTGPSRVGQPAGSANRMYGANVVNRSVNRAVATTRLANLGKLAGRAAVPLAIGSQLADIKGGFERMAKSPFIQKMGKGGKPAPSAGRRTNPKAAKPASAKPTFNEKSYASQQKFAVPKPKPTKPKPPVTGTTTRASAPSRATAPARPAAASRSAAAPSRATSSAPKPPTLPKVETTTTDAPKPPTTRASSVAEYNVSKEEGNRRLGKSAPAPKKKSSALTQAEIRKRRLGL